MQAFPFALLLAGALTFGSSALASSCRRVDERAGR
jgi:hypothetical protein